MPEAEHIILQPDFLDIASQLRGHYDQRCEGRAGHGGDPWGGSGLSGWLLLSVKRFLHSCNPPVLPYPAGWETRSRRPLTALCGTTGTSRDSTTWSVRQAGRLQCRGQAAACAPPRARPRAGQPTAAAPADVPRRCAPPPTASSRASCTTGWRMRWWSMGSGRWAAAASHPSGSGACRATGRGLGAARLARDAGCRHRRCLCAPVAPFPPKCSTLGTLPCLRSYYVHGSRQGWHTDAPHGPFAFVLSLTRWEERRFSGGETMLLQPWVLDYWRHFDPAKGTETPQLVRWKPVPGVGCRKEAMGGWLLSPFGKQPAHLLLCCIGFSSPRFSSAGPGPLLQMTLVPPRFNQLTVFDGRIPHAVQQVGRPCALATPCQGQLPASHLTYQDA